MRKLIVVSLNEKCQKFRVDLLCNALLLCTLTFPKHAHQKYLGSSTVREEWPDSCMGLREVISASDALNYYSYGFTLVFSDSPPSNTQVCFLTIEVCKCVQNDM